MIKLFVYGTLKFGCNNHRYLDGCDFLEVSEIKGYKLYIAHNNIVPFMVYTGHQVDIVTGEVYEIDRHTKAMLDILEDGYDFTQVKETKDLYTYSAFPADAKRMANTLKEFPRNIHGIYNYTALHNKEALKKYNRV